MGEVRYMISEAAKQVHVESHVLRYWEEELDLKIGRTEMGHRFYTEDDIQLFLCIKKLKNEGMLLKDLKPLIPKLTETRSKLSAEKAQETAPQAGFVQTSPQQEPSQQTSSPQTAAGKTNSAQTDTTKTSPAQTDTTKASPAQTAESQAAQSASTELAATEAEVIPVTQLEQVRSLIGDVLTEVVTSNNQALERSISKKVTTDVIREMDFLFQAKERQEEEHYRKLDCLIRQQQAARKELAGKETPLGRLKKMLT